MAQGWSADSWRAAEPQSFRLSAFLQSLRGGCREIVLGSRETAHCRSEIALVSLETAYGSRENAFSNGDKHGGWHMPKQLVPCKMQGTKFNARESKLPVR